MAPSTHPVITTLEVCRISPPDGTVNENSLPLTYFDILWLPFRPLSRVSFYDFPHSTAYFTQNVVPALKTSLSLVLKHFSPLAGNLVTPSNINSDTTLQVCYLNGDSVSLTIAECASESYYHLTGNQARDVDDLCRFVPQLPSGVPSGDSEEDCITVPVLAIQVTIFPNNGISVGFTNSHVVADGSTMFNFTQAWASIARQFMCGQKDGDKTEEFSGSSSYLKQLPFYDRSVIKDPKNLYNIFRKAIGEHLEELKQLHNHQVSTKKVQATFVINQADIQALKKSVSAKLPTLSHVSSFTVVCSYLWTCIAKTRVATEDNEHKTDEKMHFSCMMNCRSRLNPPISTTYFGNCIVASIANAKRTQLEGDEGLFTAAQLLGNEIHKNLNNSDMWFGNMKGIGTGEFVVGIAGSPRFDYYNCMDFGWGKPKKFEFVSEPLSISRCKDTEGDLEIGVCLSHEQMLAFSSIIHNGITDLCL
ncbi:Malonyltransferase [Heracleum sosnowskyi]|uniref:Malonyltransferase n=1 Tax=Heracleum sosnowskyi TaxID=360622 RepID=A0AAD8MXT9_9APIA|nr:Malonyltransferase [Heracleum sosnowskyi]